MTRAVGNGLLIGCDIGDGNKGGAGTLGGMRTDTEGAPTDTVDTGETIGVGVGKVFCAGTVAAGRGRGAVTTAPAPFVSGAVRAALGGVTVFFVRVSPVRGVRLVVRRPAVTTFVVVRPGFEDTLRRRLGAPEATAICLCCDRAIDNGEICPRSIAAMAPAPRVAMLCSGRYDTTCFSPMSSQHSRCRR